MRVAFTTAKAIHFFSSKNISVYAIFNDQRFNDTLTNDIVSFEQLGPVIRAKENHKLHHDGHEHKQQQSGSN